MRVIINYLYERNTAQIYLKDENEFFGYDGNNIVRYNLKPTECPPYDMKPFLKIPIDLLDPILRAISESAKERNISTENENHLKGKLEATEFHLSDMSNIAKDLIKLLTPQYYGTNNLLENKELRRNIPHPE